MRFARYAIGVPGALDHHIAAQLAQVAESAGYGSFWVNDTPQGDGLDALAAIAKVTDRIRLGVGVIPVDRKPAEEISAQIEVLKIPPDRLLVGIGSGAARHGAIDLVRHNIATFKTLSAAKVAVGALGPKMVGLAAHDADAVLLNWLTPEQASKSAELVAAETSQRRSPCETITYVRLGNRNSEVILRQEAARYNSYPQYRRHFDAMAVDAFETCMIAEEVASVDMLASFTAVVDETVLRIVPASETASDYLELLNQCTVLIREMN